MGWWQRQQCGYWWVMCLHAHQVAGLLDVLQNNFVGSPDLKACKLFACFFGQVTAIVHGDNEREPAGSG